MNMLVRLLFAAICMEIVSGLASPTAQIKDGKMIGVIQKDPLGRSLEAFLGIPFAKPPVGKLRFKHPVIPEKWDGVLDATRWPNSCYQANTGAIKHMNPNWRFTPTTRDSEDCLYLNVMTPTPRPINSTVMVFVHGGAYIMGSTSSPTYDPSYLVAQENVILVSMNYRLGALGFLYMTHPDIDANCGLMDQVLALKWVRDNIADFGGDPKKVTLFGQSAGAMSVGFHTLSPLSRDLFQRVIMESGTAISEMALRDTKEMLKLSDKLSSNLECSDDNSTEQLSCLLNADPTTIYQNEHRRDYSPLCFYPVIDGKFLIEPPEDSYRKGDFARTEILSGITKNEGTFLLQFIDPINFNPSKKKLNIVLEDMSYLLGGLLPYDTDLVYESIIKLYQPTMLSGKSLLTSIDNVAKDYMMNCAYNKILKYYTGSELKSFGYHFNHRSTGIDYPDWLGVIHTEELNYVLGHVFRKNSTYNEEDRKLARRIARYWANFARTGDPNNSPLETQDIEDEHIYWPHYTVDNALTLELAPNSKKTISKFREVECKFWNNLLPYLRKLSKV